MPVRHKNNRTAQAYAAFEEEEAAEAAEYDDDDPDRELKLSIKRKRALCSPYLLRSPAFFF